MVDICHRTSNQGIDSCRHGLVPRLRDLGHMVGSNTPSRVEHRPQDARVLLANASTVFCQPTRSFQLHQPLADAVVAFGCAHHGRLGILDQQRVQVVVAAFSDTAKLALPPVDFWLGTSQARRRTGARWQAGRTHPRWPPGPTRSSGQCPATCLLWWPAHRRAHARHCARRTRRSAGRCRSNADARAAAPVARRGALRCWRRRSRWPAPGAMLLGLAQTPVRTR